ncbi:hypothetical protein N7478_002031 [Penicillium angulare]|uniref:uncharacterized protein n=1 Tax=Penicillium angulare TaxID=116970 RepID=UPI0025411E78|nr:uncharacterized protein N7478_002031 [Penicillium angulare]KAJ5289001.1 hypothetical protein N7478_002031 [Penicillium angulare]
MHFSFPIHLIVALIASGTNANLDACPVRPGAKALYLQSNEQQNSVISIPIGSDGKLYGGIATLSGGMGSDIINAMTNAPAESDALSSQSSVFVIDDVVFAVNAGSNTLSMFRIDPSSPTRISMVGEPATIPGEFPVTVAASMKRKTACVGYTGARSGVSCARFTEQGLQQMAQVLDFRLNQTTPPVGPTNTVAQVFFAASDTRLVTTVKGNPTTNNTGFISVLAFQDSHSSVFQSHDVRSSLPGTAVLFGGVEIPHTSDLFITDASFGATVLSLDTVNDKVSLKNKLVIANQQATCWAAYSPARGSVFVTDAALDRLIEITPDGSKTLTTLNLRNGDPGLTELKAAGRFVYALSPGNGTIEASITVVDTFEGRQIQHFELEKLGGGQRSQGLAIY